MEKRRQTIRPYQLTSGPGKLTRALGIDGNWNGKCLLDGDIWVEDSGERIPEKRVIASPRIGIDYAGADAKLPWRFHVKDNRWVSV
jgi:DNA-3-methyladenine glycosylase